MTETNIHKYTFNKKERICSRKTIDLLFSNSKSFIAYPLRVVYNTEEPVSPSEIGVSILISVSKRKFKRAVKRNRVKRLVKEAYRLNKELFSQIAEEKNIHINIAFLFLKDELPTYTEIEKSILKTAKLLSEKTGGENVS